MNFDRDGAGEFPQGDMGSLEIPTEHDEGEEAPRPRECEKIRHRTFADARRSLKEHVRKYGDEGRALQLYWCGRCGAWHLGHKRPGQRGRNGRRAR